MKRLIGFILMCSIILTGCGNNELSFSEVSLEKAKDSVKTFVRDIETEDTTEGNGIYILYESNKQTYLYLNQIFLDTGKYFGSLDVKTDDKSYTLYLSDSADGVDTDQDYKLYEINLDKAYEKIRVYKNSVETSIEMARVIGD